MRYREVSDETMLQGIVSVLSDSAALNLTPAERKIVRRYRRWIKFIRTKPTGPLWQEHPER